ncbi:hypothetical protein A2U01_0059550 [Trifolium medium]|uniref:Uncharacterized protein n=1 Tax=Trifolium medium TaxID=97028 RepID=A0A392RQ23_9FABA|nr:hypothetical protein [Trifolium medium]
MVDMNELEAAIQSISATLKKFREDEEVRHTEYLRSRSTDVLRMDRIEAQLAALQVSSASNGGLNSSMQESMHITLLGLDEIITCSEQIEDSAMLEAHRQSEIMV